MQLMQLLRACMSLHVHGFASFEGLLPMWLEAFFALYKYVQLIVGADPPSRRFRRWTSSLYGIDLAGGS